MIKLDKYALECDLAETYQIYDIQELPLLKVALFSYGLRANSRIKLKMSGEEHSLETLLLAGIMDRLSLLWWSKTDDGMHGINKPNMVLPTLLGVEQTSNKTHLVFDSGEAFENARREILTKGVK